MDMKDVRDDAQLLAQLQRTSREKRETHEIVPSERPGWVVEVAAAEQLFVVEQVTGTSLPGRRPSQTAAHAVPLPRGTPRGSFFLSIPSKAIASYWKNDTSIDAQRAQGNRKRPDNVTSPPT